MDIKYIFLSNSLPFEESGYSPQMSRKLVKLLPLGLVHSTKGDFLVDHESFRSIRNRFMERQLQIPIDYEHQTLQDVQAPAAGWIKNIVLRNDGIGRNPDLDTTQATSAILKSGLLQKISSAEEEFNDMPIEKAGRLFVQLIKADADRKRTDYITKRKAELALDQMEADLLAQIRQYPDLTSQLKDVLNQARTRIIGSELE